MELKARPKPTPRLASAIMTANLRGGSLHALPVPQLRQHSRHRVALKHARGIRQQKAAQLAGRHPLSDHRPKVIRLDWVRDDIARVGRPHWLSARPGCQPRRPLASCNVYYELAMSDPGPTKYSVDKWLKDHFRDGKRWFVAAAAIPWSASP
eukprot:4627210-Amphidinium_carterae.1